MFYIFSKISNLLSNVCLKDCLNLFFYFKLNFSIIPKVCYSYSNLQCFKELYSLFKMLI